MGDRELGAASLRDQVARLFEEAREDVYRYLLTLGLAPPQAQEAAQDVFLRLYVALKKGEEIRNPRAWIFRVAHNLGLKIRRRRDLPSFAPGLEARIPDPARDPEEDLLERERLRRIDRGIQELSEQQRNCLFLRMEGLRYAEIGAVLGIGAPTVGEFLRRAMAKLKKVLHDE